MIFHHIFAMLGFIGALSDSYGASDILEVLFLAELTSPFFYMKMISESMWIENRQIVRVSNVIFLISFVYIRYIIR